VHHHIVGCAGRGREELLHTQPGTAITQSSAKGKEDVRGQSPAAAHLHGAVADADRKCWEAGQGVIAKPTNYKRPFSSVDFSVLTTKQGRPMGEPLIGVGTHVPAGLPTNLRYNQLPEMVHVGNHCTMRKGHSNTFPFHSCFSAEVRSDPPGPPPRC
jgi:hypothetical protein